MARGARQHLVRPGAITAPTVQEQQRTERLRLRGLVQYADQSFAARIGKSQGDFGHNLRTNRAKIYFTQRGKEAENTKNQKRIARIDRFQLLRVLSASLREINLHLNFFKRLQKRSRWRVVEQIPKRGHHDGARLGADLVGEILQRRRQGIARPDAPDLRVALERFGGA